MKELYAEGLAIHGGPESCVDDPRGNQSRPLLICGVSVLAAAL